MIECKRVALPTLFLHQLGKLLILTEHCGQIFLRQGGGIIRGGYNRLHAEFAKSEGQHFFYVVKKIGICMSEGAAHIVVFSAARFYKLLKFRDDALPASVSGIVNSVSVMYLPSAVKGEDYV